MAYVLRFGIWKSENLTMHTITCIDIHIIDIRSELPGNRGTSYDIKPGNTLTSRQTTQGEV